MSSYRQGIVTALETLLKSRVTSVSNRVFCHRKTPLTLAELPAVEFFDNDADTMMEIVGIRTHNLKVTIIYQAKTSTADDLARNALDEIAQGLFTDRTLGGLCETMDITGHNIMVAVANDVLAAAQLDIVITYRTAYGRI